MCLSWTLWVCCVTTFIAKWLDGETRLRNDLLCDEWDVKLSHSFIYSLAVRKWRDLWNLDRPLLLNCLFLCRLIVMQRNRVLLLLRLVVWTSYTAMSWQKGVSPVLQRWGKGGSRGTCPPTLTEVLQSPNFGGALHHCQSWGHVPLLRPLFPISVKCDLLPSVMMGQYSVPYFMLAFC